MSDDPNFIDLMKAQQPSEPSDDVRTHQRNGLVAFFILIAIVIPSGLFALAIKERPGGLEIAAIIGYTIAIIYISSNRFLEPVPWNLLTARKFLLMHALALVLVVVITAGALAIEPQLPAWMLVSGRRGSFFGICYFLILAAMAFYECFLGDLLT